MMAQMPADRSSSSLFFQKGEVLITKVRKGHLLQAESQTCHQQMPKLQLAQTEIKFCPLKKHHDIENCVVLCCLCVIHVGIISPRLSRDRQRAAVMHRAASAPTKARQSAGRSPSPGLRRAGRGKALLLPALCTKTAHAGQHRIKGALRETINLHDLMKTTGENNNNNNKRINP